uniref:Ribokinase n=1 Tax=Haptolina ericina TaxID=156174 RepID=A0A7S3AM72_9EUKA
MAMPGETLMGSRFEQLFGGKGANQAVAAGLLGSSVTMVAKLGADSLGEASLANFKSLGVDVAHVTTTSDAASGVAQITVDSNGQNEIIIVPGANGLLPPADVDAAAPAFARSRVLLTQLEVPLPTTIAALRAGRAAGLLTVFNTAPAPPEPLPDEIYELCDIICPNETETSLLTGMPTDTLEQCEAAARSILSKGAKAVCMTLGSRGCMLVRPDEPIVHVTIPKECKVVKVVDTTGAGDAFLGAMAHLVASGRSLVEALSGAVHVASISVQRRGAQASYPTSKELPPGLAGAPTEDKPAATSVDPAAVSASNGPKRAAALKAVDDMVVSGNVVGVGTGSTVNYMLERLAERLKSGALTDISAVPTSKQSERECERLGIPCMPGDSNAPVDVSLGSADAVDASGNVIKGGKGAMLREKLVQECAAKYVVVVDQVKLTERIGTSYPIPVEIAPIYAQRTLRRIATLPSLAPCDARLRVGGAPAGFPGCAMPTDGIKAGPFVTDNGNLIVDIFLSAPLADAAAASAELTRTPGVLEHGLFLPRPSTTVLVGRADGSVTRL